MKYLVNALAFLLMLILIGIRLRMVTVIGWTCTIVAVVLGVVLLLGGGQ